MKHVTSYDPRKKQIVEAFRRKSGGTKITNITETKDGFKARALTSKTTDLASHRGFAFIGDFTITKEEAGLAEPRQKYEEYQELQAGINTGAVWHLEGAAGRYAMNAIEAGVVMLGVEGQMDYYGNYVPSRTEVKAGTKGSREYVVERSGEAWVKKMEEVK